MTLTLNPTTSIRPLGEEQLRMFRRTMGGSMEIELRVELPKEVDQLGPVFLSVGVAGPKALTPEVERAWPRSGYRIATVMEALMDRSFIESGRMVNGEKIDVFFVSSRKWRSDEGLHRIDREKNTIEPITEEQAKKLPWHEVLYVSQSPGQGVDNAIRKGMLLYLQVIEGQKITLIGSGGTSRASNVVTQIALVKL